MHYATSDGDGNKKGFRQGGEQATGGQNRYAGKHPVGTGAGKGAPHAIGTIL